MDDIKIYVCPDCGSENVLEPTWVYANGNPQVIGHIIEGVGFDLCEDCHAQMNIIPKEEYVGKIL